MKYPQIYSQEVVDNAPRGQLLHNRQRKENGQSEIELEKVFVITRFPCDVGSQEFVSVLQD